MKIKYLEDTDTVLLEIGSGTPMETRELSEDIYWILIVAGMSSPSPLNTLVCGAI